MYNGLTTDEINSIENFVQSIENLHNNLAINMFFSLTEMK